VSADCRAFRERLTIALSGSAEPEGLTELSWHEHLLGCADCRALLEAEEVLETLLASLPAPQLPPALTERVLARLAGAREDTALDALLELDRVEGVPEDLAGDVLSALRPHRRAAAGGAPREEDALDRLLDRVPAPDVPVGLAERTLRRLERHRRRPRPGVLAARRSLLAVAAALLISLGYGTWMVLAWWRTGQVDGPREDVALVQPAPEVLPEVLEEPSEELLASLELLESWDLLTSDDLELALASLDEVDGALLELEGGI
jgi:hypothetical protein